MTLNELVTEIQSPPQGGSPTVDNRLQEFDYIVRLVNEYRAKEMADTHQRNGDIFDTWVQPFIPLQVLKNDKDETGHLDFEKNYGKIDLPRAVQFKKRDNHYLNPAIRLVKNVETGALYYPQSRNRLELLSQSSREDKRKQYYFLTGDQMYLSKFTKKVYIEAIFVNPLEAYIFDNLQKDQESLIIGNSYSVENGTITHAGTDYSAPANFVATTEEYTGSGRVYSTNKIRKLTIDDPYPCNDEMIYMIKEKIWTKEFQITLQSPKDETGNADEETINQIRSNQPSRSR